MKGKDLKTIFRPPKTEGKDLEKKKPNPVVVWILIAAIVFLAVSSFTGGKKEEKQKEEKPKAAAQTADGTEDYVGQLETRLAETLKKINGAGAVSVFISIDSGGEKFLATDQKNKNSRETTSETTGMSQQETEQSVVLSGQSAGQSPYVVEEKMPAPVGVLVVAEGAKDEKVKYEIYEAVKALVGLSAHRIKVTY